MNKITTVFAAIVFLVPTMCLAGKKEDCVQMSKNVTTGSLVAGGITGGLMACTAGSIGGPAGLFIWCGGTALVQGAVYLAGLVDVTRTATEIVAENLCED